jgi:glycolate oxidase iron-sulfur subunit
MLCGKWSLTLCRRNSVQTQLAAWIRNTADGRDAEEILRRCVHCGFCNATCPTYQVLGDELDGPRGRIYLIKQALEGEPVGRATQLHLDRCLVCRNCETTCPSGVQYSRLLDIGRRVVERRVERDSAARVLRWSLAAGLTGPAFAPALKLAQSFRAWLPGVLRDKVVAPRAEGHWPARQHPRRVVTLPGCVQPSMQPNINAATARVLDALGIETVSAPQARCCGAIRHHLSDDAGAHRDICAVIDAWWPLVDGSARGNAEAIVINASGCAATVREYGHLLRDDPAYAVKAKRIAELTRDVSEVLQPLQAELAARLAPVAGAIARTRVAFQAPCTLQHALKLREPTEALLRALGLQLLPYDEAHLCCGSAGTYSVLQPLLSGRLRERKLERLLAAKPDVILSANIGCIAHLQAGTETPVLHWIEWLDQQLQAAGGVGVLPLPRSGRGRG